MTYLTRTKISGIRILALLFLAGLLLYASSSYFAGRYTVNKTAYAAQTGGAQAFQELIELSQKEKRGLTFFIKGQTVAGGVVKIIGNEAVEVRSQVYSRIIIRLENVDAIAIN